MLRFFKKAPKDFSFLHTDVHSHILPGIDDGAPDVETSVELVRQLVQLGYRRFWATPHVMEDWYPNTYGSIEWALRELCAALIKHGIDVEVGAGAEYHIDDGFRKLLEKRGPFRTLPGNRVLVEISMVGEPPAWEAAIFQLQTLGYQPVLAHPERYLYLREDIERLTAIRQRGVELQVNLLSLDGYYGHPVKTFAQKLVKKKLVDFVGTDCHHQRHVERLQEILRQGIALKGIDELALKNPILPNEESTNVSPNY